LKALEDVESILDKKILKGKGVYEGLSIP
jgi:hypothetical protein